MLTPAYTLTDLFDSKCTALNGPLSLHYGMGPRNPAAWPGLVSGKLAIMGTMSCLCPRDTVLRRWQVFHRDAGLPAPARLIPYDDHDDLQRRLHAITRFPRRLVVDYQGPPGMIPDAAYRVDRALLSALNNKGQLEQWACDLPIPPRRILSLATLRNRPERVFETGRPMFLKCVSDGPSGGGDGIRWVQTEADVRAHLDTFASCTNVVAETDRPYTACYCLNFAVFGPDRAVFLGAGNQVISDRCVYNGNWFDPSAPPPAGAVAGGHRIALRAAARGYIGFAGMDIGILPDGGWEVVDLNFRINGSTSALLLLPAIRRHLGSDPVALYISRLVPALPDASLSFLLQELDRQHLFVLSAYAPPKPAPDVARVKLLYVGADRHQVLRRRAHVEQTLLSLAAG